MFTAALKEHKSRATKARRDLDARKRDVTTAIENISAALTQQLTGAVPSAAGSASASATASGSASVATGSSGSSGSSSGVSGGVARLVWQQNALEAEAKTLQTQSARFARQTGKWLGLYKALNDQLKELGDVRNWAQTVERDMLSVATALAQTVSLATGQPVVAVAVPQPSAAVSPASAVDAKTPAPPATAAAADDAKRRKA